MVKIRVMVRTRAGARAMARVCLGLFLLLG
jgi:hypothetical protein